LRNTADKVSQKKENGGREENDFSYIRRRNRTWGKKKGKPREQRAPKKAQPCDNEVDKEGGFPRGRERKD